jgi:hypothetical protein
MSLLLLLSLIFHFSLLIDSADKTVKTRLLIGARLGGVRAPIVSSVSSVPVSETVDLCLEKLLGSASNPAEEWPQP